MQQPIQLPSRPGFRCGACREDAGGIGNSCPFCNFDLHVSCAMVNMSEERLIRHPSHPEHSLRFSKYKTSFTCDGCGKDGQGFAYRCAGCDFDLHTSCAMVNTAKQQVVQHEIHPGHRLTYAQYPCGFKCSCCGRDGRGNGYGCVACKFDLHITCAMANIAEERGIQHPSHPGHYLSLFKYKRKFRCDGCGDNGHGSGYGCAVCNFDLHISCAKVNTAKQLVIQDPIHPGHRLAYLQYAEGFICNGCGQDGEGSGYGCVACNFDLHISCATLNMPEEQFIEHPIHPGHHLRYVRYPYGFYCDGCGKAMHRNGYRCSDCNFDLHESCATAPPPEDLEVDDGVEGFCH